MKFISFSNNNGEKKSRKRASTEDLMSSFLLLWSLMVIRWCICCISPYPSFFLNMNVQTLAFCLCRISLFDIVLSFVVTII